MYKTSVWEIWSEWDLGIIDGVYDTAELAWQEAEKAFTQLNDFDGLTFEEAVDQGAITVESLPLYSEKGK